MSAFRYDNQKLQERDPNFLRDLFVEINPRLLKMLASRGIRGENAEELVHECWETFFSNLDKFEGRSQIQTFVFGILINKIRENRRHQNRVELEDDSEKVFARSFTNDGWWRHAPPGPDERLERTELGTLLEECLEGLTMPQRSAFMLIESEGEPSDHAASLLGVTVSHLRVLVFRAKDKLRHCLEGRLT